MHRQAPKIPRNFSENQDWARVQIVLDGCNFEVVSMNGTHELVDASKHKNHIRRVLHDDIAKYRQDVVHQSLLHLLDSPLCLSGNLEIFLRTSKGIILRIDPQLKCPRNYEDFSAVIVEALHSFKVRSDSAPVSVVRVVRGPIFEHFVNPGSNTLYILTVDGQELVDIHTFIPETIQYDSGRVQFPAFVIGGFAKGEVDVESIEKDNLGYGMNIRKIKIHNTGLTAAQCCSMVTFAFETVLSL
eukprot:PhF_6_TR6861/c0_g1_i1/m.9877/K14568/EMG1, NEP1; rRNA small subunit pseudouridine methyltransferase Nep1